MNVVVVAGGAGFIGSNLCRVLLEKGEKVICIDNFITGDKKNIQNLLSHPQFSFFEHDVTQPLPSDEKIGQKIDAIFHLASPASPNKNSARSYINFPIETLLVNSVGTHNLLELAKKHQARFLFASSSEVYGDPEVSPQPEEYFGNVNPNGVRSVYDEAKRFGEAITMAYVRKYDLDARIIRIFNTYGPNMQPDDGRVVSNLLMQAINNEPLTIYGSGDQTRSFCYVDDMVAGILLALFSDNTKGEVINLGNPDERSIADFAVLVQKITNTTTQMVNEPLPQDDPQQRKPDITKAKRLLHWEPKVSVDEGLTRTFAYFKNI